MKRLAAGVLVALVGASVAFASPEGPPYRRPPVALAWQQHRAVRTLFERGEQVYCGGPHGNAVALTFDDGPGPYTAQLLRELRAGGAHATFFVVGNRLQYWPWAVRAESRVGVVGNHTWSHPHLEAQPRWLVWLELARTQWQVQQSVGWKPRLFRVPYGQHDAATDAVVHSLGLLTVFWSVDSRDDVAHVTARQVARNVLAGVRPGAIVIMHDIHPWTVAAVPRILHALRLRGLRAVSVPELLALDPTADARRCPIPRTPS